MGFTEDYLKLRNKRQKEKEKETDEEVQKVISTGPFKSFKMQAAERGDIAPVTRQFSQAAGENRATDWNYQERETERTWFDSGAFDDGYQFGDVTKTILGSGVDLLENIGSGIMGMGEAAVDAFAAISPYVMQSQMSQVPVFDEKLRQKQESLVQEAIGEAEDFVAKDLYDEREVAKAIITNPFRDLTGIDAEKDSVFGERSDSLVQSAGQLAATFGLQMAGVPWFVTTGVTSFGSEAENALQQGASLAEANASGFISAGAEVLSEKLFGGDIFVKGAGADMATTFLSTAISNKTWRTMAKLGMDVTGEGVEEVFSQVMSNLGSSLYKEKDLGEILFDEEALDSYLESFIGGAVLGGGMSGINVVKSNKAGVDYVTELTKNEQAVVDKVYQDRVAEAEKDGKISQKEKGKIYNEVLNEMEKGYISTDTIEEVLGGEEYASYAQTKQTEEALRQEYDSWKQEYDELYEMKLGDKSSKQVDREAELKNLLEQRKKLLDSSPLENMRTRMGESVFSIVSGEMKGQGSRLMESYNERARRGQAYEADLSKYDQKQQAVIQKAIDSGILNNTNRTHEFVDMVAKISADKGVLFDFTNNEKLKNSGFAVDGKFVNGYVTKDGVTVNIQSKKALNSIVGHEITHVLEGTEFYDTLSEAVKNYAIAKEGLESFNKRLKTTEGLYKGMDAEVDKEIVADLVGDYLFTDSEFINRLSTENRNIFEKIYDEVKYLFKVATAGSKEARELEKVKKAFEEAYRAGGKAQTDTKYSISDSDGRQLTPGQQEYFKDSKMRDADGNLMVMYHGTDATNFTVFDPQQSDDKTSLFFTSDPEVANTYTKRQDYGRDVDPYNMITADSSAEQFNAAQERVGGGLRVLKITQEWIQEIRNIATKESAQLVTEANKYADLLVAHGGAAFENVANNIRNITNGDAPFLSYKDTRTISSALFDISQRMYWVKDKEAAKKLREQYATVRSVLGRAQNYSQAAEIQESAIGEYTYTEKNSAHPFSVASTKGAFGGKVLTGTESEMVAKALERTQWSEESNLGNRYKVYLNLVNPFVFDASAEYSGRMDSVSLEHSGTGEGWRVEFENAEHDVIKHMTTSDFMAFIESAFDAETSAKIKAQIEADNEAYRKDWGDDFYDDMDVYHDIQLRNVTMNYVEPGTWNSLNFNGNENARTRDVTAWAKENGYDGVIFKNIKDSGGYAATKGLGASTVAVAFDSNQIKSTANAKPTGDADIRYSLGEGITEEQNQKGLDAKSEVSFSLSNDTAYADNAIAMNQTTQKVAGNVMVDAKALRGRIAARMNDIKDRGLVGLPEDIEGNTYIANSSYDGTEENTTICPRSLASEAFTDAVAEYLGRPLTVDEQIYISQDLQGRSLTPECTYCYVATDRKAYRAFLGEYVAQRDAVLQKVKENPNADVSRSGDLYKEFLNGRKDTNPMYSRFKMWVDAYKFGKPMIDASHLANINKLMGDINSEFGAELKPQIVDAMKYAQSASWAKKRVNYVAYNGHILKWKQDRINKLNSHYGLRMYSFSDFHPAFVLENMQMITDASVRGLKMLGYTKDTDFVDIFAPSGMNINVSTFGFEAGGNVYENNIIGAEWEKAKKLREQYPNVGVTFVATNDTLVNWALEQDWIDVVIPYHLVRTGTEVAKAFGYTNYTSESSDTKDVGWAKVADKKYIAPTEHNNDKATYLAALQKNHLKPRFERFIDNPNYMKLVNECRQPASVSKPVQPVFNEDAAMVALAKLEANGYYQPIGGSVDRMYEIAAEVAESMTQGLAPAMSLSEVGEEQKSYGTYNVYGKDVALEAPVAENAPVPETVSEMESVAPVAVSEMETTTEESSVAPVTVAENATARNGLAEIAKQARRENFRGAYTLDGKQYLGDGSFVAEFNTEDETLEQSAEFPAKRALKELDEAYERQVPGNYDLHTSDANGYVKVGDFLYDAKYVNALIQAIENPVFSLSNIRGGANALLVSGENGRALLMPVRAGDNVNITYEAQPVDVAQVTEADLFPDEGNLQAELDSLYQQKETLEGRMTEAMNSEDLDAFTQANTEYDEVMTRIEELESEISETESARADSLTDADVPPETEPLARVPSVKAEDPFADRDESAVGNRSVKAYQYENPEVRPFFQDAAYALWEDLDLSQPAERWYNDELYYESGGEKGFGGQSRLTTKDIGDFKDRWGCSWEDLRQAVRDIIDDNGKENYALAKRVEFLINDRLMYGYTNIRGEHIRPNQAYLDFLKEKQITEYSAEARENFFSNADQYAPYEAPVAPVSEVPAVPVSEAPVLETVNTDSKKGVIKGQQTYITTEDKLKRANSQPKALNIAPMYEAHTSKGGQVKGQQSLLKSSIRNESDRVAKVLTEEPAAEAKKSRWWSWLKNNVFDRGMVFEDVALKEGNRELQAKWNSTRYAEGKAQKFMTDGADGVKPLQEIMETVESSGKTKAFFDYLYHQHNVDRMTLEERFGVENKTVFGDTVTADVSKTTAEQLEKANPEFKAWSKDVYRNLNHLRKLMVDNGIISRETAYLWARMYPHYVPVGRVGHTGLNINVPLDTGRTGVNAPIKKAVGGSSDIRPLFTVMGERTIQTFKAIAKNSFGVELKNTLGTTIEQTAANLDETIDSIDNHDELLKKGEKGKNPTFTVFENGKRVTFEITEDMYDAMKPAEGIVNETIKPLNIASNIFRGLVTEYNPTFMLTNPIKDVQDVLINSQHPLETYMAIPKALSQMASNGHYYEEYLYNGGEQNSYFDDEQKTFSVKKVPAWLDVIGNANNAIERLPRLAEYIASREAGASIDVAMLDAARVTTNFAAGGAWTKFLNRNGATFLNASMQGAVQQVRNIREAKVNGVKGWVKLATKALAAGLPAMVLNHLLWDDDEEYQEISDYVKQNYYIVGKYDDGKFIRIPKGRTVAVIQNAFEQMENLITGDDEVDLGTFLELAISNLAPNNPLDNNIFAPIAQVAGNRTWYGEDLIPTRLQNLPAAEQYDESTDEFSKWLGGLMNYSPYKINYLLNQYGGGLADTVLPMLTPEAESGDSSFLGTITAPFRDKFTTDSVLNNQNVTEFYDLKDELTINANSSYATDEDMLKSKYMNSINSEISELYKEKREIQNSDLTDEEKYAQVRDIQQQIVDLMKEGMGSYEDITYEDEYRAGGEYARVGNRVYKRSEDGGWEKLSDDQLTKYEVTKAAGDAAYASDGENHYRWYEKDGEGEWRKITEDQLEKQEKVTSGLRISPEEYWENKEEYDYAYESPENYAIAKSVGGYEAYRTYSSEMYDIKADKDENGKSISGSRKEKVWDYISGLDISDGEKYILFKSEYNADDTYNYEIIDYLNENDDISYEDMVTILKKLGFTVDSQGNISWD